MTIKVFLPNVFGLTNPVLNTWGGAATTPVNKTVSIQGDYNLIQASWNHADVSAALKADNENYLSITGVTYPEAFQPFAASKSYDIYA